MKQKIFKMLLETIGAKLPKSNRPGGKLSKKFRYYCAKNIVAKIGDRANIEQGASLQTTVEIGESSAIGVNCLLTHGVIVGRKVMMGPECLFYTQNHMFNKDKLGFEGYTEIEPIYIEDGVWLGARCTVLPGVRIGKGSAIGANSVVTKNVPAYSVVGGNPAKVLKNLLD